MKNFKYLAIAVLISAFTACSSDNAIEDTNIEDPLKSFSVSKSAEGKYTLEHTVAEGINSTLVKNKSENKIILSEGDSQSSTQTNDISLVNGEIKINFQTETALKIPGGFTLYDVDRTTAKGKANKEANYVKSYQLSSLNNGSYQLDFTVDNNLTASFEYNSSLKRNEIRLKIAENNGITSYSKNYTKLAGEKLNIVFILVKNTSLSSKAAEEEETEIPPVIVYEEEEEE